MRIIYALIAGCLSLQACNQAPTVSMSVEGYGVAEQMAAMSLFEADHAAAAAPYADFYVDEYNVGPLTTAAIKPIDGAEFAGTSRDDADTAWSTVYYLVDHDPTATVSVDPDRDNATAADFGFYIDEEGGLVYGFDEPSAAIKTPPWP
jgi:hypothetical protein